MIFAKKSCHWQGDRDMAANLGVLTNTPQQYVPRDAIVLAMP